MDSWSRYSDMDLNAEVYPPRPRLTLRVGVTGHRLNKLPKTPDELTRLSNVIRTTLSTFIVQPIQLISQTPDSGYLPGGPRLIVISPMADGADRLVAQEALNLGFDLQCALPFAQQEYEQDFKEPAGNLKEFHELIKKATAVIQLDGSRSESGFGADEAYELVGRTVSAHSDILIAIWDGIDSKLRGGTAQIVGEAKGNGCPVLWIHSQAPHEVKWLLPMVGESILPVRIESLLWEQLLVSDPVQSQRLARYFDEQQKRITFGGLFETFCKFLSEGKLPITIRLGKALPEARREWDLTWDGAGHTSSGTYRDYIVPQVEHRFLLQYAWADRLAKYYGNVYRSSFLLTYTLSGLAVLLAALSPMVGYGRVLLILEAMCIACFTGMTYWAKNKGDWQQRWLDYRLLAEYLRHMRFLWALGLKPPLIQAPAHHGDGDPRNTWVTWFCYAIKREAGLVSASHNREFFRAHIGILRHELQRQIEYHDTTAKDFEKIQRRGQLVGYVSFVLTIVACLIGIAAVQFGWDRYIAVASTAFPAIGAAFAAILSQGEFGRIEAQSSEMAARLRDYARTIDSGRELSYEDLSKLAEGMTYTMMSELVDWRVVFLRKPLELPR